jgi:acetyltransferase
MCSTPRCAAPARCACAQFTQLFSAAKCLASRYRPVGKRLAIVTNGGGPGVLAADWVSEIGWNWASLLPPQAAALAPQLPRWPR